MMTDLLSDKNEQLAQEAFSLQSKKFDKLYGINKIVEYKRERVRTHLRNYLLPDQYILELNSGTGEDAIWLARQQCRVHATDISVGMMEVLKRKVITERLENSISFELCSFTNLKSLTDKGPYDMIFSNFGGLNCTTEIKKVLESFDGLLKPKGIVTLVLLPKFCLWESLLLFKAKFKTATRRIICGNEAVANIEGISFRCRYYNPSYITKALHQRFRLLGIEGLCTIVPPSYIENFAEKYPSLFLFLKRKEEKLKNFWPWKLFGDYYIISLQKR